MTGIAANSCFLHLLCQAVTSRAEAGEERIAGLTEALQQREQALTQQQEALNNLQQVCSYLQRHVRLIANCYLNGQHLGNLMHRVDLATAGQALQKLSEERLIAKHQHSITFLHRVDWLLLDRHWRSSPRKRLIANNHTKLHA